MAGNSLFRALRRRSRTAMIWAMLPVVLVAGKPVSGCMSPTGHIELGCNCQAMQQAGSTAQCSTCSCHCPCCRGKTCCCCCLGKSACCQAVSMAQRPSSGKAMQNEGHCRPYAMYVVTPAVKAAAQSHDLDHPGVAAVVSVNQALPAEPSTNAHRAELNTGPPPENLVVALHRFLI